VKVDVLIAGAGFSGLGMAIQLRRKMPAATFLIVEKADDIGGTWYENHYPGCACDIPSHLYSFSFERNAEWSRMFSGQLEIQNYLKRCVEKFALKPHIRLASRLCEAVWDETVLVWKLKRKPWSVASVRCMCRITRICRVSEHSPGRLFIRRTGIIRWT